MIVADTSVWIDHLRKGDQELAARLTDGEIATHKLVIEELACGHLAHRGEILGLLEALPSLPVASHEEVLEFVAREALQGLGLGAVDVHLLASARLGRARLWTRDKALAKAAKALDLQA